MKTIHEIPVSEKWISLTFDDGPHPDTTPEILSLLNRFGAKGCWFVTGALVQKHPYLITEIAQAGHDIGVQSYDAPLLTSLGPNQILNELGRVTELVQSLTGSPCRYFRPPMGASNRYVVKSAESLNYPYQILWSLDARDNSGPINQIITRVLSGIKPGAILLFHENNAKTLQVLPGILEEIYRRGYQAAAITDLLQRSLSSPSQCRILAVVSPFIEGDDVAAVQQFLLSGGYDPGPVNGIYGLQTADAVRRFQHASQLMETGNVDLNTYAALGISCPETQSALPNQLRLEVTSPPVQGDDVRAVQTELALLGYDPGPIDGTYGPRTAASVKAFQSAQSIPATGIVDDKTFRALGITL